MFEPRYFAGICQVFSPGREADVPEDGKIQNARDRERGGRICRLDFEMLMWPMCFWSEINLSESDVTVAWFRKAFN